MASADPGEQAADVSAIAHDKRTEGFSGADLSNLVREAGLAVMREWREKNLSAAGTGTGQQVKWSPPAILARHFEAALARVRPSVALEDRQRHGRVHQRIREGMGAIQALNLR
jgi:ribosome biogenesis ATPase